jgi:segregation and condensation protein A
VTHPKASAGKRGERRKAPAPEGFHEGDAPPRDTPPKHLAPGTTERAAAEGAKGAGAPGVAAFEGQYRVDIPAAGFEGPLDLLLHLIQQHELDILDIPIRFITEKFLQYLAVMRTLSIDVASEYLVMAATLAHIKSKMLLPSVPEGQDDGMPGEEEEDPRAELVRRLLEYQKYKAAAADLAERGTLGKDVFGRGSAEEVPQGPAPFADLGVFSLLDAFEKVLKRTNVKLDHEIVFDRISITDRILQIHEKLEVRKAAQFEDLLAEPGRAVTRFDIVITFLAILEMAKLRMIRVYQSDPLATIHVELASNPVSAEEAKADETIAEPEKAQETKAQEAKAETAKAEPPASEAQDGEAAEAPGTGGEEEP